MAEREVLPNSVTTILRQAILKGDIEAGEKLVQADLASQLGVSRMPVREALKTLEVEGLVTVQPHRGAIVNDITLDDIAEIYEIRAFLEPLALKKSIPDLTSEDVEELQELHGKMKNTTDPEIYIEYNRRFHNLTLSRCYSKRLHNLMTSVSHGLAKETPYVIPDQIEKSNREHDLILQAIITRDTETAAVHYSHHIERTGQDLMKYMKGKNSKA